MFCFHPRHYFTVNRKTNHLAIIDNTIFQYICKYIVTDTTHLSCIIILISTIKNIKIGTGKQKKKKNEETSDTLTDTLME